MSSQTYRVSLSRQPSWANTAVFEVQASSADEAAVAVWSQYGSPSNRVAGVRAQCATMRGERQCRMFAPEGATVCTRCAARS
jgi:hypothetical protein